MTGYLYPQEYRVLPFVYAPVPSLNEELSFVIGPKRSLDGQRHLIRAVSRRVKSARHLLPITTDIVRFSDRVIIATTVSTDAEEAVSGRTGMKFTYGAIVDMSAFQKCPTTFSRITMIIEAYLAQEFMVEFSIDGVKKIMEILQAPSSRLAEGELVDRERAEKFLTQVEVEFGEYQPSLSPLRMLSNRIRILRLTGRRKPTSHIALADSHGAWKELDQQIAGIKAQAQVLASAGNEGLTKPDQLVKKGRKTPESQPTLPGAVLLEAFQRAISSISSVSYLVVALLIAWLLVKNLILLRTDTSDLVSGVVYGMVFLMAFMVLLQLTERYLFLWALWRHMNLPRMDKAEALPKSVLMSPTRLIIISLLTMVSLVVVISIMLLSLDALLALISWQSPLALLFGGDQ